MNSVQRLCACLLAALLIQNPMYAAPAKATVPVASAPMTADQRALHLLDRLSFGPRPGDVARVEAMGIPQWIDRQLNPEGIDDSALQARLAAYPAMQLSPQEMERRYPSQLIVRQLAAGRGQGAQGGFGRQRFGGQRGGFQRAANPDNAPIEVPNDPVGRAIYANQIAYYQQKKAEEAGKQEPSQMDGPQPAAQPAASAQQDAPNDAASGPSMSGSPANGSPVMAAGPAAPAAEAETNPLTDNSPGGNNQGANGQGAGQDAPARYSEAEVSQMLSLPPDQRIAAYVSLPAGDFRSFVKQLTPKQKLLAIDGLSPEQKETVVALVSPTALITGEVVQTRMLTDIYSERQLQAVMTDFWLNHFNVYMKKGPFAPWYLADYQNNVVGPRALGKFEDLLVATAQSPAMLFYLDNHTSVGPHSQAVSMAQRYLTGDKAEKAKSLGLNENYAREVMELHTLGVDGGYTQQDVTELAKVFTGWTIGDYRSGGEFEFNERRHEPGTKHVLGKNIKENGMNEGLEVLHMLATSPATAHLISQQLAVRFVSDNPPAALVDRMAATFLKTDGDIRSVLRTMMSSPEFWSKDAYRAKVKTPEEFVFSAVRASGADIVQPQAIVKAIDQLGMPLYGMQTPNGYSWKSDAWVNSGDLIARINFAIALTSNRMGAVTDLDALLAHSPGGTDEAATPADKELKLEQVMLNFSLRPQTRATVLKQLDSDAAQADVSSADAPAATAPSDGTGVKKAAMKGQRQAGQLGQGQRLPAPADKDAAMLAALLLGSPDFQYR